jgi:1-acyl-sn-glycerol-3-phosphate acyltransferase
MPDIVEYGWSPNAGLYHTTRAVLGGPIRRFFHAEWYGAEHVPDNGAVVLACNHLSNLDPILLGAACPREISFLAKVELFRVPLIGSLIRRYGAIPLRRGATDPEALRLARRVLESGCVLALFPEGTRSRDGTLKPFRFGAARLALRHGAALVPAAIVGTNHAMPAGARFPRRVPVRVAFAPPLAIDEYRHGPHGAPDGPSGRPEPAALETITAMLREVVAGLKSRLEDELMNDVRGDRVTE